MEEILIEIKILQNIIEETAKPLKMNSENGDKANFGKVLYALTRNLTNDELINMSNDDMIEHIRKIQITEKN